MNRLKFLQIILITGFMTLMSGLLYASEPDNAPSGFFPTQATQVTWIFTGIVTNENGENYNYLFQFQRDNQDFSVTVALFDAQTKKILLQEHAHATLLETSLDNWTIGQTFLRFNPMNNSWIFGMRDAEKNGFNFKVDTLSQLEHEPVTRYFRHGVSFFVMQTGQLNGHIQLKDGKEQFVTARNAWFRQIWKTGKMKPARQAKDANSNEPLTEKKGGPLVAEKSMSGANQLTDALVMNNSSKLNGLLCRFNDGSGLYAMKLLESNSVRGAVAGLFDGEGSASPISQFIHVEKKEPDSWLIRVASPKMQLIVSDMIQENTVLAGFIDGKSKSGFCVMSQDDMVG